MDYSVRNSSEETTIMVRGKITFQDHGSFNEVVDLLKRQSPGGKFAFDLENVDFIDSAAMGMFVIASDAAKKGDVRVVLRKPGDRVRRVMELANFERLFAFET